MNRLAHRLIYNHHRGMLMAVAESTVSCSGGSGSASGERGAKRCRLSFAANDPRFTNYRTFISSDYMLTRLNLDPATAEKRLGDGFYEQQLINQQINQLTGRKYLEGYTKAEAEYKALMDAGIAVAKSFNLTPGIALTDAQIAALTHDIVWLVEQSYTLPDGTVQRVLVPQVYLTRSEVGDLRTDGTLISATDISLRINCTLDTVSNFVQWLDGMIAPVTTPVNNFLTLPSNQQRNDSAGDKP